MSQPKEVGLPTPSRRSTEALRLAKCFVSDPKTREKLKARQRRNGKAWVADMIDEAIIVSRELIRLLSKSDTPRTDSVLPSQSFIDETRLFDRCYYLPLIEHARQLERELAAPSESTSPASDSYPHPKRGSGEAGSSPSSETVAPCKTPGRCSMAGVCVLPTEDAVQSATNANFKDWTLVPNEPTPEMVDALNNYATCAGYIEKGYRAMLKAAPKPTLYDEWVNMNEVLRK